MARSLLTRTSSSSTLAPACCPWPMLAPTQTAGKLGWQVLYSVGSCVREHKACFKLSGWASSPGDECRQKTDPQLWARLDSGAFMPMPICNLEMEVLHWLDSRPAPTVV